MVEEKVLETIRSHNLIRDNEHIVLGLSGGPDSVCLFHVLLRLKEAMNLHIYPVHINHKLRVGAAEEDQAYVTKLCEGYGLKCRVFTFDCNAIAKEKKITSEEAGRLVRYDSFRKVAREIASSGIEKSRVKIAVAQNADDQAETILFRILRGTGTSGLAGISYKRLDEDGNQVIRPLLDIFKKDILDFCNENNLNPCIDKTNEEAIYTRNKIRLNLLPYLEENFNGNIKEALIHLGASAEGDNEYINGQAEKIYGKALLHEAENGILFKGEILKEAHRAVRQRIFTMALARLGLREGLSYAHYEMMNSILENPAPSARGDLPKGFYITKVYADVKLSADRRTLDNWKIKVLELSVDEFEKMDKKKDAYCAFDKEALEADFGEDACSRIEMRQRREGDKISLGEKGSKKLQNYFTDCKIPRDLRDSINLISIGGDVLMICHKDRKPRYSGKYRVFGGTKSVIYIELFC